MKKELEDLLYQLVKSGRSAEEIRQIAGKHLGDTELRTLWSIPRQNINNFVISCLESRNLKPPFLDVGCGKRSYRPEVRERFGTEVSFIALDHYLPNDINNPLKLSNLIADITSIPLVSSSVNTVLCTEVLEHVENDSLAMEEISRVTKNKGILILTLPGADMPKHEKLPYQVDYRRYNLEDIENLLTSHNFVVLHLERKTMFDLEINLLALAQKF